MNLALLHPTVQQFINQHLKTDITKLILKGSNFQGISVQELANQIVAKHKSEKKLHTWFGTKNIYFPPKLSIEQTSSETTAKYKASLVKGNTIIDITGGFGVDSFYFSKQFKNIIHCEINSELSNIVNHNYKQLGCKNISCFSGNGIQFLKETPQTFDCIYIDPSRRNDLKSKVFLLKDCQPFVPPKIDFLFTKTTQILLKVSPILDISNTLNDLKNTKEIHIVAVNNEVKELLFLLEKDHTSNTTIKTVNLKKESKEIFNFINQEEAISTYAKPLTYLYEPNAAILKSGAFHKIANALNIFKLQQHTHLYTSEELIDFPGRIFKIESIFPYQKKKINKQIAEKKANITIRNFPKSVAQIRKETKLKDGGNLYVFFCKDVSNKLIVITATKQT